MGEAGLILVYAIPAFVAALVVESRLLRSRGRPYVGKDTAANIAMGFGNLVVLAGWGLVQFAALVACSHHALWRFRSGPWAWAAVMMAWDFQFYWNHRAGHEVRVFWATHVNHHSSRRFNLSTALRQDWTPMFHTLFMLPLALAGFSPVMIVAAGGFNLFYQFWIHTELVDRLGPLEWVLNTPSHHRVHHGSNPRYLDKNYGGVLIVWDRLFGTFEPETEPVIYGLTRDIDSYNPFRIAFHEWAAMLDDVRRAARWSARLGHLVRGPEWSPLARPSMR